MSLRNDIKNLVGKTVKEMLNAPLDEEASELVGAEHCPRAAAVLEPSPKRWPTSAFPPSHWKRLRANNVQERTNRERKRRSRVVQAFPSTGSLVRLAGAVMRGQDEIWQESRHFSGARTNELYDDGRTRGIDGPVGSERGLRRRPGRCSSPASSLRTGSKRHGISAVFQVLGRRADSLRIGLYTNFPDTTPGAFLSLGVGSVSLCDIACEPTACVVLQDTNVLFVFDVDLLECSFSDSVRLIKRLVGA